MKILFSNDEDFADDKKTSCSLTIVSAFCFSSLIFASRTSKWQLSPWKIIICLYLILIFSSTHFFFSSFLRYQMGKTSSTRFLKALSVCSQLVRRFEATCSRICSGQNWFWLVFTGCHWVNCKIMIFLIFPSAAFLLDLPNLSKNALNHWAKMERSFKLTPSLRNHNHHLTNDHNLDGSLGNWWNQY